MMAQQSPITVDYVSDKTHNEFHLPLSVFKRPSNQEEYDSLESVLDELIDEVRDNEDHPLAVAMQVIGDNLEDFDNKNHPQIGKNISDIDLVSYLMEKNSLVQKDMVDVFSNQGNVSKFLNGERKLSNSQILKLVRRFNISADVFFK